MMHNLGLLIVTFNSARLVRKGEELEHYHPKPTASKSEGSTQRDQLTTKMA